MKKINNNLAIWREAWNKHKITTLNACPTSLFTAGSVTSPIASMDMDVDDLDEFQNIDEQDDARPVFSSLGYEISETCENRLIVECPRDLESTDFGIDMYEKTLRIVMSEDN